MDFLMFNHFNTTPISTGHLYRMETEDGTVDVFSHCLDPGMVISVMEMWGGSFTNRNFIGKLNCFDTCTTVRGRLDYESKDGIESRPYGTMIIDLPSNEPYTVHSLTGRASNVSIGVDLGKFTLYGDDGNSHSESILKELNHRYVGKPHGNLYLDDDILLDIHVILDMLNAYEESFRDRIHFLVSDIIQRLHGITNIPVSEVPVCRGPEDEVYDRLVENLSGSANIEDICREIGYDRHNICRRFRQVYGRTPYSFHKHLRLMKAAEMLLMGETDITAVAKSVGYSKESKFAESFREKYGCNPRYFRDRFWSGFRVP